MADQQERLRRHFFNPYDQDRIINRWNAQPGEDDAWARYALPALAQVIFMARQAAAVAEQYAVSWREFYVGAGGFGANLNFTDICAHYGSNIKVDGEGSINEHAEDIVIGKARKHGHQLLSLVVVGNPQEDHESGRLSPTLHPCGRCRQMLTEATDVITPRTTIFTATPDLKVFEMFGLEALKSFHQTGHQDSANMWQFDMPSLDDWDRITLPLFVERLEQLRLV